MTALPDIISRCEATEQGNDSLDHAIALELGVCVREYSQSVDAALTLVPEGCHWRGGSFYSPDGDDWVERPQMYVFGPHGMSIGCPSANTGIGATPALALCVATLRARLQQEPQNG